MYSYVFRSWKLAALFAFGIMASAAAFFVEGGGKERLDTAVEQVRKERAGTPDDAVSSDTETIPAGFAGDEELIDKALSSEEIAEIEARKAAQLRPVVGTESSEAEPVG